MPRGQLSPQVRAIARQLDVPLIGGADPTTKIVEACVRKVEGWLQALGPAETFDDLIEIVAAKLKVHFEVIDTDDDLDRVVHTYLRDGETGFVDLRKELDGSADAVVMRLLKAPSWSNRLYVAVIDARGERRHKVWFSKWHELAHLIAEPQTKFAFRRTPVTRRDPVERIMDQIAGELAFYPDLLLPSVDEFGIDLERPALSDLVRFRDEILPFSSLHAALIALLRCSPSPIVLVEAKLCLKASEQRAGAQAQLFPGAAPERVLRAFTTAHNPVAVRQKLYIHRWMRVPERSVIHRVYYASFAQECGSFAQECGSAIEDLSWWESQGKALPQRPVAVEAMRAGPDRVLALVKTLPKQ